MSKRVLRFPPNAAEVSHEKFQQALNGLLDSIPDMVDRLEEQGPKTLEGAVTFLFYEIEKQLATTEPAVRHRLRKVLRHRHF